LRPLHLLRAVHRGVPDPLVDDEQRVRARPRLAAGPHLHQGAVARAAAAGDGAAAAPDAVGRQREGLLRQRADQPGHLGGCRAGAGGAERDSRVRHDGRRQMTTAQMVLAAQEVSTGEAVTFWILAPLALLGAIGMVWARNAVHSALWL